MKKETSIDELIKTVEKLERKFQEKVYNGVILPSDTYEDFENEITTEEQDNLSNMLGVTVKCNPSLPKGWYALESGKQLMIVNPDGEYGILEKPVVDWNFKPTSL